LLPSIPSPLPLILASASPRRRELLSFFGLPFEIVPSQGPEDALGAGREQVAKIARDKCGEVAALYPDRLVLAADTLVCVDDQILGKPKDALDAAAMLRLLSGRWHDVYTGVCLRGPGGLYDTRVEATRVEFVPLSGEIIDRYVATGEPMDKAGAYAIQGISGIFISRIDGSPSNVIGLPLSLVGEMLRDAGIALPLAQNAPQINDTETDV
jgi:septum formation protein